MAGFLILLGTNLFVYYYWNAWIRLNQDNNFIMLSHPTVFGMIFLPPQVTSSCKAQGTTYYRKLKAIWYFHISIKNGRQYIIFSLLSFQLVIEGCDSIINLINESQRTVKFVQSAQVLLVLSSVRWTNSN